MSIWEIHGTLPTQSFFQRFASQYDRLWFLVLRVIALLDGIWVPVLVSFFQGEAIEDLPFRRIVFMVEFLLGATYLLGTGLRFFTSAVDLEVGREYVDPWDVLVLQLGRPSFWADVVSLPGNFWWCFDCELLSALRLLRLWRLPSMTMREYQVSTGESESFMQAVLELMGAVYLIAHFYGCAWYSISTYAVSDLDAVFRDEQEYVAVGLLDLSYSQCLAAGAAMLVGWSAPQPISKTGGYTPAEKLFLIVCGPTSSLFMAYTFAKLLGALDKAEETWRVFMERLNKISTVLNSLNVPDSLKVRVVQYHAFLGVHNIDKNAYDVLFHGLSSNLHVELKLFLFEQLVLQAPFFQVIPPRAVMSMVRAFDMEVFSPGDMILKKGEVGAEMFFLMKGSCDIMIDDEATHVVTQKIVGDYFGEVALVLDNQVRTAWVCARVFCVLAKLTKKAFQEALSSAPEVQKLMLERIEAQSAAAQKSAPPSERTRKASQNGQGNESSPLLEG